MVEPLHEYLVTFGTEHGVRETVIKADKRTITAPGGLMLAVGHVAVLSMAPYVWRSVQRVGQPGTLIENHRFAVAGS